MPAMLSAPQVAPVAGLVEGLSNGERAVALYASDMPTSYSYKRDDDVQLGAWIAEGALRVGLPELHRSAAFLYSFQALELAGTATRDQQRAHKARFPSAARLRRASSLASLTVGMFRVSDAAIERSNRPQVEGACRCAGTGWFEVCFDPDEPTSVALESCAAHNPNGHMPTPVRVFA
ncbi:hypothetical protein ABT026_04625 [Streptomyces sp. NPDC002734]|uniref:hypothetical protein n=1 Tax=Streptomyces sp. NPDC002734 TaxID=3154426 RepID=UPI0033310BA6